MWDPVGAIPCDRPDMAGYPQGATLQIDKLLGGCLKSPKTGSKTFQIPLNPP